MRDVYTKNPALGDPNSTDKELAAIGKKLDNLRLELQKYQVSWLSREKVYLLVILFQQVREFCNSTPHALCWR